jgi:hypothetical protein
MVDLFMLSSVFQLLEVQLVQAVLVVHLLEELTSISDSYLEHQHLLQHRLRHQLQHLLPLSQAVDLCSMES